ncbi:MAG: ZIP family metal transporter [Candidatus Nealsonbacteria bacterium]
MSTFLYIILTTFFISLISFSGVLILFLKESLLNKILLILVAFSAGTLIGGAFLHLIPEAISQIGAEEKQLLSIFLFVLLGFCIFFILEQFISWHHHHVAHCEDCPEIESFSYLILISDSIHNFIDGIIISASFIVSIPAGIITALAVAFHEIPQEIGDFGVLVYGGFKKTKALFLNFLSAITIIFGGIIGFLLSEKLGNLIIFLLPFAAGHFIYIASADLIPEIKHKSKDKKSIIHFFAFLLGIALMFVLKLL